MQTMIPMIALLACLAPAPCGAAELPEWLVGEWRRETRRGVAHERWQAASARTLEGDGWLETTDGARVPTESLRIVLMGDDLFFIPRPRENPLPVAFRLIESAPHRIVFENPDHDFPTRIGYELREDGSLLGWISGPGDADEERARRVEFVFAPVVRPGH